MLEPKSRIMIVGSGGLHDVPMEGLIDLGHELILVDIIHLPSVRRKYEKYAEITFVQADVTAWVEPLYEGSSLRDIKPARLAEVDLVISLNILSQLPLCLKKYAGKKPRALPDDFDHQIMAGHLNWLKKNSRNILLIGDVERLYLQGDAVVEREDALPSSLCLPAPEKVWDWPIAPRGEVDRKIAITHRVGLWHL